MGLSTNHATFDGLSFKIFLQNLAALAADKPLTVIPSNDRHALAARSPPRVTHDHPEMIKLIIPPGQESNNAPIFDATPEDLDFKIFRLTSSDISDLKTKAASENGKHVTGFNVVTALIWRCKALSYNASDENEQLDRESRMLYAVDIRSRLNPPLPVSYTGNAVLSAYATARCEELKTEAFWKVVERVAEGAKRMSDEYARSAIDWGEINRGYPHGEFLVSSWWRLGFSKVEYPWGKPRYSCPVVYHKKDIILFFPDIDDENGINVLVSLPSKEMLKFETLFYEFLG